MAFYSSLPGQTAEFVVEDDRIPQRINSNQRVVENLPRQVRPVVRDYHPGFANPVYQPTFYQPPQQPVVQVAPVAPVAAAAVRGPTEKKCCTTQVIVGVIIVATLIAVGIGVGVYFKVKGDRTRAREGVQSSEADDAIMPCANWITIYNKAKVGSSNVGEVFERAAEKFASGSVGQLFDDTMRLPGTRRMKGDFRPMEGIANVDDLALWLDYTQGSSQYNDAVAVFCSSQWTWELFDRHRPNKPPGHNYGCSNFQPDIPMCY